MKEQFFYALVRVSVAQILKAAGFERCKPLVLNQLVEVYLLFFLLLVSRVQQFKEQRIVGPSEIHVLDLTQAFLDVGLLKPSGFDGSSDRNDGSFRGHRYNTCTVDAFKEWVLYSLIFRTSKQLARVPPEYIASLLDKRSGELSNETDQDRKKRRLRQRQEYYNRFMSALPPDAPTQEQIPDDPAAEVSLSWLDYLVEKDWSWRNEPALASSVFLEQMQRLYQIPALHSGPFPTDFVGATSECIPAIPESPKPSPALLQALPCNSTTRDPFLEEE